MKIDMDKIAKEAMEQTIRRICEDVIYNHAGWGLESDVKNEIKEITRKIVNEPEMKAAIKKKIMYWIEKQ